MNLEIEADTPVSTQNHFSYILNFLSLNSNSSHPLQ